MEPSLICNEAADWLAGSLAYWEGRGCVMDALVVHIYILFVIYCLIHMIDKI